MACKPKGWPGESQRHAQAARGIKTTKNIPSQGQGYGYKEFKTADLYKPEESDIQILRKKYPWMSEADIKWYFRRYWIDYYKEIAKDDYDSEKEGAKNEWRDLDKEEKEYYGDFKHYMQDNYCYTTFAEHLEVRQEDIGEEFAESAIDNLDDYIDYYFFYEPDEKKWYRED